MITRSYWFVAISNTCRVCNMRWKCSINRCIMSWLAIAKLFLVATVGKFRVVVLIRYNMPSVWVNWSVRIWYWIVYVFSYGESFTIRIESTHSIKLSFPVYRFLEGIIAYIKNNNLWDIYLWPRHCAAMNLIAYFFHHLLTTVVEDHKRDGCYHEYWRNKD